MKDYHINIFYSEEDEAYIADIPDLKYVSAIGSAAQSAALFRNGILDRSGKTDLEIIIFHFCARSLEDR